MNSLVRAMGPLLLASSLSAPLSAESIDGLWTGVVSAPQGDEPIALDVGHAKSGRLVVTMTMPVMHVEGVRLLLEDDGKGGYAIGPLDTTLHVEGGALAGSFALGNLPMRLTRGGEMPTAAAKVEAPEGPEPAWTTPLGAETWMSPVVRDGTIFVGTTDGVMHAVQASDGSERWKWKGAAAFFGATLVTADSVVALDDASLLVCLDRADGTLRWRVALRDGFAEGNPVPANPSYNHRTPAPVMVDGIIYVGSADGRLYAVASNDGAKVWHAPIGGAVLAAPAINGDTLIVPDLDGSIVVLSREDGHELRRTRLPKGVVSTPVVVGDIAVVGCRDYMLYGLNLEDLSVAWRFSYWFSWVESMPSVADGTIYVGASDYRRVTAIDAPTGKALWAADVGGLTWGTPLIAGDTIFAGSASQSDAMLPHTGGLVAIDRATGRVKWRHPIAPGEGFNRSGFIGSLALSGNLVIGATFDGQLVAFPGR